MRWTEACNEPSSSSDVCPKIDASGYWQGLAACRRLVDSTLRDLALVGKGLPVHRLRHTFCSHLAMKGAPAKAIQELAGHADLATTMALHAPVAGVAQPGHPVARAADATAGRAGGERHPSAGKHE